MNFSLRRRASFYSKNFLEELLHYDRSGSENSDQVVLPSKRFSVSSMVGRAFHQTTYCNLDECFYRSRNRRAPPPGRKYNTQYCSDKTIRGLVPFLNKLP